MGLAILVSTNEAGQQALGLTAVCDRCNAPFTDPTQGYTVYGGPLPPDDAWIWWDDVPHAPEGAWRAALHHPARIVCGFGCRDEALVELSQAGHRCYFAKLDLSSSAPGGLWYFEPYQVKAGDDPEKL